MVAVHIDSAEIAAASLHKRLPLWAHIYAVPFALLYPLLAYAYFVRYDDWLCSEEWTFLACVSLGAGHALSFLATRWSTAVRAVITCRPVAHLRDADCIRVVPVQFRGKGEIVGLKKKKANDVSTYTFLYQQDTYVFASEDPVAFKPLPYPSAAKPPIAEYQALSNKKVSGLGMIDILDRISLFGKNEFHIPVPAFGALFAEHATAPFFVFQIFCVALWCLDEYWYYSIFTLVMLVIFECTVVWQRQRTLTEFRSMSIEPYEIKCYREKKWITIHSDLLFPGDIVSVARQQQHKEGTIVPADLLLVRGTCIVNEAMLSGESTPLLKESIELLDGNDRLDVDGSHKNSVLFGGTRVLQSSSGGILDTSSLTTPDGGCLAVVLRTGFGTAQGSLVRTMLFSSERVSANNMESFLFIAFLLCFAAAASAYVWLKGLERGLKKSKLLLDCVMILTSVVPPELPMELSLAVNASLVALQKYAIFCTEPFRIPFAGRLEVLAFDKTGTLTKEDLVVEGVAGVDAHDPKSLVDVQAVGRDSVLCLATAHALVRLDDGMIVGDPMEKAAVEALGWQILAGDRVSPISPSKSINGDSKPITIHPNMNAGAIEIHIRRRFQFSSALKRMSTVSTIQKGTGSGRVLASVKGAPEIIKKMLVNIPQDYDETYKYYTRRGSRVLALACKDMEGVNGDKILHLTREEVESKLRFAGFLIFHCPLKDDAVETLRMLNESSHRCIMITGDNPLTAAHVARDVEIVDREVLILDLKENASNDADLEWRTVDESKIIPVNPSDPLDEDLLKQYDICITGAALRQYENRPAWNTLVQHTWVYARVSPAQKEFVLTSLKSLGFITLMAGDGTNDVGALKHAHVGVALLDGTVEDLQKIAEHQKLERIKKVYETQLKMSARFNAPPPPVPPALAQAYPEVVQAHARAAAEQLTARQRNPMEKFNLNSITNSLADMDTEDDVPKIKLGDASCAAPFTSKLSNVASIAHIIRQGRCTLVATIQMYKILALNCLISAYALSVQYLDGIKYGDYQVTITGMLMSVCFLCISRAKPVEKLSRERPLGNIFNLYVFLSILIQFAIHIVSLVYITMLSNSLEDRGPIDLEAKFEPNLLNTAIYLLGLSQQVSTFAINFQGRPFREGIRENPALYYGLLGASAVAFSGATDFLPEFSRWLQIVEMTVSFRFRLTAVMVLDFAGCWIVEFICKRLFAESEPKELLTRGRERRDAKRQVEAKKEE